MSNRSLERTFSPCLTYTTFLGSAARPLRTRRAVRFRSAVEPARTLQGCIPDWFHRVTFKPGFQVLGVRDDFRNLHRNRRRALDFGWIRLVPASPACSPAGSDSLLRGYEQYSRFAGSAS